MSEKAIEIFTDGSCHTELKTGGWAAILFIDNNKITIEGTVENTSHNRMELLAVLKALEYLKNNNIDFDKVNINSDSQYVVGITERKEKLKSKSYLTNKGTLIQNSDLVQSLIQLIDTHTIDFIKVKAHKKKSDTVNYNREVDMIVRKLVREDVKKYKD